MSVKSIIPWSWTHIESYETCPRQFYELRLARNYVEADSPHLLWGKEVHDAMEKRIMYDVKLPARMATFEHTAMVVKSAPGIIKCELKLAFTQDLKPTGFFADDVYHRGADDVLIVNGARALNIDWKTGKPKHKTDQLKLAALRTFVNFPEVNEVGAAYAWLQSNEWTRQKYTRADIPVIHEEFERRLDMLRWSEKNNAWPAKPSGLCKKSKKPGSSYGGCIVASCPHSQYYRG